MADVQNSEVDAKLGSVNVGALKAKFGSHRNQAIFVLKLNPYLCDSGSHSLTHCLTDIMIVGYVTMQTKVRSIL
jgi:hypothetical protein